MATSPQARFGTGTSTLTNRTSQPASKLHTTTRGSLEQSRLLSLPAELRLQVFEYVFEDVEGQVSYAPGGPGLLIDGYLASERLSPLLTCRQLYSEFQLLAFGHAHFTVTNLYFDITGRLAVLRPKPLASVRSITFVADDRHFRKLISWSTYPYDMQDLQLDSLTFVLHPSSHWHFLFDHTKDMVRLLRRLKGIKRLVFLRNNARVKGSFRTWCNRFIGLILKIDHEQRYLVEPACPEQVWWTWKYDAQAQSLTLVARPAKPTIDEDEYMRAVLPLMEELRLSVETEEWNPDPRSRIMYY